MTVGLLMTAIFSVFGSYFFVNIRDKAIIIMSCGNYAIPCWPVIDCKRKIRSHFSKFLQIIVFAH